jgi:hypothetical protein
MEACLQLDNHIGLRDLERRVVLCVCALCLTSFTHHAWCVVLLRVMLQALRFYSFRKMLAVSLPEFPCLHYQSMLCSPVISVIASHAALMQSPPSARIYTKHWLFLVTANH